MDVKTKNILIVAGVATVVVGAIASAVAYKKYQQNPSAVKTEAQEILQALVVVNIGFGIISSLLLIGVRYNQHKQTALELKLLKKVG